MSEDFVSIRCFGEIEVAVYHVGQILSTITFGPGRDWLTPDVDTDAEGRAVVGQNGMVIRTADAVIAIDPTTLVGEDDNAPFAEVVLGPTIEEAFEVLGIEPGAVTHVLITHGHTDHFFGVLAGPDEDERLRFPNADHYFPAADWRQFVTEAQAWPEGHLYARIPRLLRPVERAGQLRLVSGDCKVLPGVTLLHTAGETPGHQVVRLETSERPVFYLGDLVHLPIEVIHTDWAFPSRDPEIVRAGRERILGEAASSGATVVFTHGRFPAWGTIDSDVSGGFRWRYEAGAADPLAS